MERIQLERDKSQQEIYKREIYYKDLENIYNTLPIDIKQLLIELYNLPQQNYINVRILKNDLRHNLILIACQRFQVNYGEIITIQESFGSRIITIDAVFCEILGKHANLITYRL